MVQLGPFWSVSIPPPEENLEILGAQRCILRPSEALLCMQADCFLKSKTHMDIQHKHIYIHSTMLILAFLEAKELIHCHN